MTYRVASKLALICLNKAKIGDREGCFLGFKDREGIGVQAVLMNAQ